MPLVDDVVSTLLQPRTARLDGLLESEVIPISPEVDDGHFLDGIWLHGQVGPRLCAGLIGQVVDVASVDLVWRKHAPPRLVSDPGCEAEGPVRDVEALTESLVEGEGLDQGQELSDGIGARARKRKGRSSSGHLSVHHNLESVSNVNAVGGTKLGSSVIDVPGNWPACCGRERCNSQNVNDSVLITSRMRLNPGKLTSHLVQESVLVSIQRAWSDDGSPIKGLLDQLLTLGLGSKESRRRVLRGVEVRDVDEARDTSVGSDGSDALCAFRVDVVEGEVPM